MMMTLHNDSLKKHEHKNHLKLYIYMCVPHAWLVPKHAKLCVVYVDHPKIHDFIRLRHK